VTHARAPNDGVPSTRNRLLARVPMAKWRAEAIQRLPELRRVIAEAETVMAAWIELRMAFEDAYEAEPPDDSLIARIYSFADWCLDAPRNADAGRDPFTAVLVAFYEDIPTIKAARDDMPRWFTYDEVARNRQVFSYHLRPEEFDALVLHMARNRHRYVPRDR
jgi:hypothetical protein